MDQEMDQAKVSLSWPFSISFKICPWIVKSILRSSVNLYSAFSKRLFV